MFRLDGKTALVTGASQGIGHGIAVALARQGARVVLAARNVDKLQAVATEIAEARWHGPCPGARPGKTRSRFRISWRSCRPSGRSISWSTMPASPATVFLARMSLEQWREVIDTNPDGQLRRDPRVDPRHDAQTFRPDHLHLVGHRSDGQRWPGQLCGGEVQV